MPQPHRSIRQVVGGRRPDDAPTGEIPLPTLLPVTARQAAAVRDSLAERHRRDEAAASSGMPGAAERAAQAQEALHEVERYVDYGGGMSDGLVELLADCGIVIVPLGAGTADPTTPAPSGGAEDGPAPLSAIA